MSAQSSMHFYLNWAKERIDEMDAALGSLEAIASRLQADSKVKADQLIADFHKRRDEFEAAVKKEAEAGEVAWVRTKAQLESQWNGFEAQVKAYIDTVGERIRTAAGDIPGRRCRSNEGLARSGRFNPRPSEKILSRAACRR